jgi:ferrous iron transport protein A
MAAFYAAGQAVAAIANGNHKSAVRFPDQGLSAARPSRIVRYATSSVAFGNFFPRIARTSLTSMPRTPASTALSDLAIGSCATLATLELPEEIQGQLMHLGFVPESRVLALRRAPAGDPTVYCVDGAEVALRKETAKFISVHSVFVAVRKDAR